MVFKATSKKTKEEVAVKVMLKKGNKKDDVEREVQVLKKLTHPNILGFHDYEECGAEYVLVMELWVRKSETFREFLSSRAVWTQFPCIGYFVNVNPIVAERGYNLHVIWSAPIMRANGLTGKNDRSLNSP